MVILDIGLGSLSPPCIIYFFMVAYQKLHKYLTPTSVS